jgi:U3 small nucleolar RNA-associated protein 12
MPEIFFLILEFPSLVHQKLQEEREKRLEETFEADLDNAVEDRYGQKDDAPEEGSVGVSGKKTKETVTATDAIIDALDTAEEEEKRLNEQKVVV